LRRGCIDIGSNTTRLLVAVCDGECLLPIHQERVFTHIGRRLTDGLIAPEMIGETAEVVARQLEVARELGCVEIHGVATAAIRRARNGPDLVAAIRDACGLDVKILSGDEEARLAFVGASRTLGHAPDGQLGVVDVGGGSSELVVGTASGRVSWATSFPLGSSDLAHDCLHSDPPSSTELSRARDRVADAIADLNVPQPAEAVAVGGSATSLQRLAGPVLDADSFRRSLALLARVRAATVARQFALEIERVRLLPAGLLILEAASGLFGAALQIGRGGLREGVLLEAGT
jgi:exopolyphosphatase / guanosine-5'-triphosphate,3'-diphosphate pyrophosphatase